MALIVSGRRETRTRNQSKLTVHHLLSELVGIAVPCQGVGSAAVLIPGWYQAPSRTRESRSLNDQSRRLDLEYYQIAST
jgi:hypothetical protein